jgi:hypothetical protein
VTAAPQRRRSSRSLRTLSSRSLPPRSSRSLNPWFHREFFNLTYWSSNPPDPASQIGCSERICPQMRGRRAACRAALRDGAGGAPWPNLKLASDCPIGAHSAFERPHRESE